MNKLFDLKFVIGVFFLVIGVLLLVYGIGTATAINKICGGLFSLFALVMLIPLRRKKHKSTD